MLDFSDVFGMVDAMNAVAPAPLVMRTALPSDPDVALVLRRHFDLMRSTSPAESCHVLEPDELLEAGATLLAAQRNGIVLGVGALKEIEPHHGELKSMHTIAEARGQGIARKILLALIKEAGAQGMTRLSLETGSEAPFAPARALYAAEHFECCAPFGSYVVDPLSVYMTRNL
ncbi:MAG: GNAT family N-acetyltransferase [Paracoccaceae bacterium]